MDGNPAVAKRTLKAEQRKAGQSGCLCQRQALLVEEQGSQFDPDFLFCQSSRPDQFIWYGERHVRSLILILARFRAGPTASARRLQQRSRRK